MSQFCPTARISENPRRSPVFDGLNSTDRHEYDIIATSELNAYTLLTGLNGAPATSTVDGIPLESRRLAIQDGPLIGNGYRKFVGIANYKHVQRDEQTGDELVNEDDERVRFSFRMPQEFFKFALSQSSYGENPPEIGNLIGVVKDTGEVQGYTFSVPQDTFSVSKILPAATVTNSWIQARRGQLGTTNNSSFRGFDIGEVLAVSFSGQSMRDGRFEMTFDFATGINETVTDIDGVDLGGSVNVPAFDYAWTMTGKTVDTNDKIAPKSEYAFVAQLFDASNFASFGINI